MISFDENLCIGCGQCARSCPMGYLRMTEGRPAVVPHRRCIACIHCAAACPKKAVRFEEIPVDKLYPQAPETELEKIVMTRRSVRSFKPEPPPRETIKWALDTAMYAPSGKNAHENRWTVLYGFENTEKATNMVLEYCLKHKEEAPELIALKVKGVNLVTCGAPCVIVAWSPDEALNPVNDPVIALTTIEIMLQSRGLATCWGGYLNQVTNKSEALQAYFGIPEGCHMRCCLMVGYADKERYLNIPYRPEAGVNWVE